MRLLERLGLGGSFAASYLAYAAELSPRLFSATFAVTNRCNLRCSYCAYPSVLSSELALPEIERMFERLRASGVRRIGLVGGEPLVRADLGEIVRLAKRIGFYVTMNTNLTLYGERPDSIDGVDLIFTSLDGDEGSHRASRGDRSHEGVVEAIAELVRAGRRVIAICVLTEAALDAAPRLLTLAKTLGFRVHFQPQCVGMTVVRGEAPRVPSDALRRAWGGLAEAKRRGAAIASSLAYLEHLSKWPDFSVSALDVPGVRCAAGRGFVYIDPGGNAYPCVYLVGKTKSVNLVSSEWRPSGAAPCTDCAVGPLLEMNLLYRNPLRAPGAAFSFGI